MTVSQMTRIMTKSSKSVHSVVLGSGRKATSVKKDLKKADITDLINAYKRVMMSSIMRGNNKLN